jgi:membrane protein DedA with SNARE-associated domain
MLWQSIPTLESATAGASFGGAYLWNTLLVAVGYLLGFNVTFFGISILRQK